ncbi:hypothetical protein BDZ97DRAFT_1902010 [Flammula alnicola]|nr:hypothetical protein BDZ97DRAFT_1902010 [Flammula alnicola]
MATSIVDIPAEVLQKIAHFATLGSPLGPPKELYNCLLTCRTFNISLSPKNAGELYHVIFAQKFDILGPVYRLGSAVVREHAPHEMRRRFRAIQIFKSRSLDHPDLTDALWIAYLMVEDSDTSQKNVKQLLRAGLPSFLDRYLRHRLYEGASDNDGWPVLNEQKSLAIALSWTLASQRVMSYEHPDVCKEMMRLLRPIVFAAFRYSIFHTPESAFSYGSTFQPPSPSTKTNDEGYPTSVFPPQEIAYFGTVKRKARAPSAAIFATLLYFARTESLTVFKIPPHVTCETREEANQSGRMGACVDDIKHFYHHCRTRFADFPGIDVGIQSSARTTSPDIIICQPSLYKLGTLSGQWQGSSMYPLYAGLPSGKTMPNGSDLQYRKAVYLTIEEHFCYDENSAVPRDDPENGITNAWLPTDLQTIETDDGMQFFDGKGTFSTQYETFRHGHTNLRGQKQITDVIITGKTDDQYVAAWGGAPQILGRVRLHDGLVVLTRYSPLDTEHSQRQVLRGYVTSSQNLVGRLARPRNSDPGPHYEGVFSLSKNHTGPSRSYKFS